MITLFTNMLDFLYREHTIENAKAAAQRMPGYEERRDLILQLQTLQRDLLDPLKEDVDLLGAGYVMHTRGGVSARLDPAGLVFLTHANTHNTFQPMRVSDTELERIAAHSKKYPDEIESIPHDITKTVHTYMGPGEKADGKAHLLFAILKELQK